MPGPPSHALPGLVDRAGRDAVGWAGAPLRGLDRVLTLRPAAGRVDVGGTPVRAAPGALPVVTNWADGVLVLPGLHGVADLDGVFAELRRVLRPAATLVVVVPSRVVRSFAELRWVRTLRPVRNGPWGHRSALDGVGWLLAAADFSVLGDDRVPFVRPLPDADEARRAVVDLPAAGLWPSPTDDLAPDRWPPGRALPVPLRRLVARR